jgi:hypothetical protein
MSAKLQISARQNCRRQVSFIMVLAGGFRICPSIWHCDLRNLPPAVERAVLQQVGRTKEPFDHPGYLHSWTTQNVGGGTNGDLGCW